VEYTKDPRHGWVPTSCTDSRLDRDGNLAESISMTVMKYKIGSPISDDTFSFDVPQGTWVNDYVRGERYILREDGTRRMIAPGEYNGHNYKQLLEQEGPGPQR
jgi:hypothetical protein